MPYFALYIQNVEVMRGVFRAPKILERRSGRLFVLPDPKLTLKRLINPLGIESHDDHTINDDHRSGHITEFLEIGQGA